MELQYESTIKDVSEPHVRLYLRGSSYKRQRWLEPIWGGLGVAASLYVISIIVKQFPSIWWIYLIGFFVGWMCNVLTIKDTVSRRIRKHLKRKNRDKKPYINKDVVTESSLHSSSLGKEIIFNLDDLSDVTEDQEYLQLTFGDVGLSTIPLRVFEDDAHKKKFIEGLGKV